MTLTSLHRRFMQGIVLFAPLSITFLNKPVLILILLFSLVVILALAMDKGAVSLNSVSATVVITYLSIFVIGFLSLLVSASADFGLLISTETLGRLFTISVATLALLAGYSWMSSASFDDLEKLRCWWLAPGGIFLFFALYQLFCNLTGKPFFLETRDWMHGVPMSIRALVPKRLTSIAEEPSFYAPVLIESGILILFLVRTFWLKWLGAGLSAMVLLLTFSGGGYVNATLLVGFACAVLFFVNPRNKMLWALLITALIVLTLILFFGQVLIDFAVNKFLHESSGGSSRAQFMSDLLTLMINADFWQLLLGNGLTSMSHLSEFGMLSEDVRFRISNNMYIDILWESGVLGLIGVMVLYGSLFVRAMRIQVKKYKELSLSLLLVTQSLITSLYRSEYISTHLIWMLLIIVWAIYWEEAKLNNEGNKQMNAGSAGV